MIHAEIASDIASISLEISGSIFTWQNDIGSDGGFSVFIYQSKEDLLTLEDTELMADPHLFFNKLIVGPKQARICWSDCYDPYDDAVNQKMYIERGSCWETSRISPYAATLQQGRWDVFRNHGDWHFVRSGDL